VRAWRFSVALERLKARRWAAAAAVLLAHPGTLPLLAGAIRGTVARRWADRFAGGRQPALGV
jgi:hypothetical protein